MARICDPGKPKKKHRNSGFTMIYPLIAWWIFPVRLYVYQAGYLPFFHCPGCRGFPEKNFLVKALELANLETLQFIGKFKEIYIFIYLSSQSIDITVYFVSGKILTIIGNNPFTIYCFYLKQSQVNVTITILWWKTNVFQLPCGFTIHKECSKVSPMTGYPPSIDGQPIDGQFVEAVSLQRQISQFSDNHEYSIWLVVDPSEKWWFVKVSWDDDIPNV